MKYRYGIYQKKALLCAMISSSLLLSTAGIVLAAEQEADSQFSFDQMVVTAERVPTKLSETAADITVVTKEKIENGNYQNLGEALRDVPGVVVTQQGTPGASQFVRLNGDDRVVVLVDGRRMNMDKGAYGRSGYDLKNLPTLANVERIEIVKGGASALYGSDAVGGVINIITRVGNKNSSTLNMETGSWGQHSYEFTNEGKQNDWSWFFTAGKELQNHFAYKDFQTGQQKDMDNSAYNKDSMTFRLDKEIDLNHSVTFNFEHVGEKSGEPYMVPGRMGWNGSYHYPTDYETSQTNNWALTYHFNKILENAGYLRAYQNYFDSHTYSVKNHNSTYNNKVTGADWQDGWRINASNLVVGGIEWRDTKVNYPGTYTNRSVNTRAFYFEDRMNLDNKWTLTPGVRYDNHNMFGDKTTSRATVNYKMDDTTNFYVSYNQIFNAPNTDDLFTPEAFGVAGNPNLKPETGYKMTYGINKKFSDHIEIAASAFTSQLNGAINWDKDSNGIWVPSNVDKQRKSGAEIQINDVLSPHWSVMAAYTYLKIENKQANADYVSDPNNSQPNGYQLGVNYKDELWNIGLVGRGASGRSLDNFTSSSYWVWDTSINYKFNKTTSGYLKVNNITNRAYETNGNDANSSGPGAFPMAGRNVQLGVQYQF